jgi:RES domain-containing protein
VPTAWRLTKTRYLATAWDGEAARRGGGRWNGVGTPVVYASGTLSLALVGTLVHLPSGVLPAYSAQRADFDESLVTVLQDADLPPDWRSDRPPAASRAFGDAWVAEGRTAVLRVPSVVVPVEVDYIFNPRHPDFARVRIGAPIPFPFDVRPARESVRRGRRREANAPLQTSHEIQSSLV